MKERAVKEKPCSLPLSPISGMKIENEEDNKQKTEMQRCTPKWSAGKNKSVHLFKGLSNENVCESQSKTWTAQSPVI